MTNCFYCGLVGMVLSAAVAQADPEPAGIADIAWRLGPNIPEFRKGGCATVLAGRVVSVFGMRQPWGEMATMYVFDPRTEWWQRGPDGPIGQTYVQGTEYDDAFYAIGGRSAPKGGVHRECYRLECRRGEYVWQRLADLNEARGWAPSVAVERRLYVFGGSASGRGPTLGSVEMLDLAAAAPRWQTIAEIPGESRGWSGAAAVDGKIYLIGGAHRFDPIPANGPDRLKFRAVLAFDPETRQWQKKSDLPYRVSGLDCCVYQDRYVIVVGGAAEAADFTPQMLAQQQKDRFYKSYYCPFVAVYDAKTDRWQLLPTLLPMPTNDIRVVIAGTTLYALGGENIEPATSNTTAWLRIGQIQLR